MFSDDVLCNGGYKKSYHPVAETLGYNLINRRSYCELIDKTDKAFFFFVWYKENKGKKFADAVRAAFDQKKKEISENKIRPKNESATALLGVVL